MLNLDHSYFFIVSNDDDVVFNSLKQHARLGYIEIDRITRLVREGLLGLLLI